VTPMTKPALTTRHEFHVAFTGTRAGMSEAQLDQLESVLRWLRLAFADYAGRVVLHEGEARGADLQAKALAERLGGFRIAEHPAGRDPLARNRDMVDASSVLVAAPATDREAQRSGTWATVRYARRLCRPVIMLSRGE